MSRIESDFLGELEIPDEAYYGVQTMRGKHNFNITEMPMSQEPFFAIAYGYVKKASVMTNKELGCIPADVADALIWACDQIIAGKYNDQFVTDWLQGGAGTSTNMNCNEVLCNLACEHLGLPKGDKKVSPNDHANFGQSTNDSYPTAFHLSLILRSNVLLKAVEDLVASFYKKAEETKDVLKMGRTHLQDAVPMSFGQEFHGWGFTIADEIKTIKEAQEHLKVVNLGATAIGTTVTTHPEFPAKAVKHLAEITGIDFRNSEDLIAATSDCGSYVALSSAVKSLAVKLTKVCNDLRLLASGPRTGLSELILPQLQPGSSIMPGKVNPTQCESLTMIAAQVMGNDVTISIAGSNGQFELNVFKPVIISNFLQSARLIGDGCLNFSERCVKGITPVNENIKRHLDSSLMLVTALNPKIGYYKAAAIAQKAYQENKTLREAAIESGYVTAEEFDRWVDPSKMVGKIE